MAVGERRGVGEVEDLGRFGADGHRDRRCHVSDGELHVPGRRFVVAGVLAFPSRRRIGGDDEFAESVGVDRQPFVGVDVDVAGFDQRTPALGVEAGQGHRLRVLGVLEVDAPRARPESDRFAEHIEVLSRGVPVDGIAHTTLAGGLTGHAGVRLIGVGELHSAVGGERSGGGDRFEILTEPGTPHRSAQPLEHGGLSVDFGFDLRIGQLLRGGV